MTGKILCPTDGTDHATVGVVMAARLARQSGSALTICVVNVGEGGVRGPTISHWSSEEAKALLDAAVARAQAEGASTVSEIELMSRDIAPAIVAYADQNGYDHIVMGTGDKHGVRRLVLGSVASSVASQAHCSVTVARG